MWASRRLVHALCVNAKRCPSGRHIHSLNLFGFLRDKYKDKGIRQAILSLKAFILVFFGMLVASNVFIFTVLHLYAASSASIFWAVLHPVPPYFFAITFS
jgi:hypothetical protein